MCENKKGQGELGGNWSNGNRNKGSQSDQQQEPNKNNDKRRRSNWATRITRPKTSKDKDITYPTCVNYGTNHLRECRQGTTVCYQCGKKGHYARGCMNKTASDDLHNKN